LTNFVDFNTIVVPFWFKVVPIWVTLGSLWVDFGCLYGAFFVCFIYFCFVHLMGFVAATRHFGRSPGWVLLVARPCGWNPCWVPQLSSLTGLPELEPTLGSACGPPLWLEPVLGSTTFPAWPGCQRRISIPTCRLHTLQTNANQ
jgi:hypothetical protein